MSDSARSVCEVGAWEVYWNSGLESMGSLARNLSKHAH